MKSFHGTVTVENIDEVADRIRQVLDGKRYTFVAVEETAPWDRKASVRTGQELNHAGSSSGNAISVKHHHEKHAQVIIGDTYGVWGFSTNAPAGTRYDPEFNNPYVVVNHHQVTVTRRAPIGQLLYWVAAVELER